MLNDGSQIHYTGPFQSKKPWCTIARTLYCYVLMPSPAHHWHKCSVPILVGLCECRCASTTNTRDAVHYLMLFQWTYKYRAHADLAQLWQYLLHSLPGCCLPYYSNSKALSMSNSGHSLLITLYWRPSPYLCQWSHPWVYPSFAWVCQGLPESIQV